MLDTLLSGPYVPFTLSLALLFGLLALEVVFLMLGATLIGDNTDAELDAGIADGPDLDLDLDLQVDLDAFDLDPGEFDLGLDDVEAMPAQSGGFVPALDAIGFGRMPTLIWLASLLMSFGVTGLALQSVATTLLGTPLGSAVSVIAAGAVALWFTGRFGSLFARLLPKTETQSVSTRHLSRRRGRVTQGTAARGRPAEVRVADRYGNTHYLRAEPMRDGEEIPQGADVLVLRHRPTGGFRLIAL